MTDTIICAATYEPRAFYSVPQVGIMEAVSVSLNYEFRCDGNPSMCDPAIGKARFKVFLDAVPKESFYAYWVCNDSAQPELRLATKFGDNGKLKALGNPSNGHASQILVWLDNRADGKWITPDDQVEDENHEVDASILNASQLLATAQGWDAPLPQDAGLLRIVILNSMIGPHYTEANLVIVPFFNIDDDFTAPPTIPLQIPYDGKHYIFTYNAGQQFSWATGKVRLEKKAPPDSTSLVDEATGYLKLQEAQAGIHTVLKRFQERSASLLSAFPQILAITWSPSPADNAQPIKRLIWRALNGLASLLDPMVIGLTMAEMKREGPFVAALVKRLKDKLPDLLETSLNGVATGITKLVKEGLKAPNPNDLEKKQKYAETLAKIFGLEEVWTKEGEEKEKSDKDKNDNLNNAPALLPVLLTLYAYYTTENLPLCHGPIKFDIEKARERFTGDLDVQLNIELNAIAQRVQTEEGIEATLVAVLDVLDLTGCKLAEFVEEKRDAAKLKCKEALAEFKRDLAESFNGADAARIAQGAVFEAFLVGEANNKNKGKWGKKELEAALQGTHWFARRLGLVQNGAFDGIANCLPTVATEYLSPGDVKFLHDIPVNVGDRKGALDVAFTGICDELLAAGDKNRFIPDHAPKPLPVQIAVDQDIDNLDNFASQYNGVALLVRRDEGPWAYANLAKLKIHANGGWDDKLTIHPLQPVAVDGQRKLFLEYDGVPLASNAFADFVPPGATPDSNIEPFYDYDDPRPYELNGKTPLPALAYGCNYDIAAHVVSNGGALPQGIAVDATPWVPLNCPTVPDNSENDKYFAKHTYRRTTAIGRVTITELPAPGMAPRIGAAIKDVQPLFQDYPRIGYSADNGQSAAFDLLRNSDGTGAITLPGTGEGPVSITLTDLWWWTGPGTLTVSVFSKPATTWADNCGANCEFKIDQTFADGKLTIEITTENGNPVFTAQLTQNGETKTKLIGLNVPQGSEDSIWLRCKIKGDNGPVTLSLADPSGQMRGPHAASRPGADSLVVLAPSYEKGKDGDKKVWLEGFENSVTAQIGFPRVGFIDFDRWLSNPKLFNEAKACKNDKNDKLKDFRTTLMAAYIFRTADPALARLVDNLPDLSVHKLLIELSPLDGLEKEPEKLAADAEKTAEFEILDLAPLGTLPLPDNNYDDFIKNLAALDKHFSAVLEIKSTGSKLSIEDPSGKQGNEWKVSINVPRGMVARLSVRPMVPSKYFEKNGATPIFDPRILELAVGERDAHVGERDAHYVFEGVSLIIESMLGALRSHPPLDGVGWQLKYDPDKKVNEGAGLASAMIAVKPAGTQRSYDLLIEPLEKDKLNAIELQEVLDNLKRWRWRQLGSIDVQTQRWRFTGRPIYSWFNPKQNKLTTNPAIEVTELRNNADFQNFEKEAFFDRDDQDADIQTMRLSPVPAQTILQSFPWEKPSATMFRHRLVLRSRYAGAMKSAALGEVPTWSIGDNPEEKLGSWIRVVMLADSSRLQLTRPQLRALIPLTTATGAQREDAATPPIMAVLDEPPFAHGGLADRIGAEIKTSFSFQFSDSKKLEIKDARKESGPDPRLSYSPIEEAVAKTLTVQTDGPIGLTFDSPTAPAPTFANSELILRPALLTKTPVLPGSLEEHFLSVSLRRYLDHRWLVDETVESQTTKSIAKPWWFECSGPTELECGGAIVCKVKQKVKQDEQNFWSICVEKGVIDQNSPAGLIEIARADVGLAPGLALLHLPLEEGRASLSVFALPDGVARQANAGGKAYAANPGQVQSNLPLMLASFEWSTKGANLLSVTGDAKAYSTSASPATLMNWTRTGKNFDIVHVSGSDNPQLERLPASEFIARKKVINKNTTLSFFRRGEATPRWVVASLGQYKNPVYVHRHIAVIVTSVAPGLGRPVEVFEGALQVFGMDIPIIRDAAKPKLAFARIVEFETPALPISSNSALKAFETASFDVFSILGDRNGNVTQENNQTSEPRGIIFCIRLLGSVKLTGIISQISLSLLIKKIDGTLSGSTHVEFDITQDQNKKALRFVIFRVTDKKITALTIFEGGYSTEEIDAKVNTPLEISLRNIETVKISKFAVWVNGTRFDREFWADVSMLTIPAKENADTEGPVRFSFDWLFTGSGQSAAEAVSIASLLKVPEAEARIVSISPPIPIDPEPIAKE